MDNIKMYIFWVLLIIVGFILVNVCSQKILMDSYSNINKYQILTEMPNIQITEAKATKINGYIKGQITNNTETLINNNYIIIKLYNAKNSYIGQKVVEINNFQPGSVAEFKTNFKYTDVQGFTIEVSNEVTQPQRNPGVWDIWDKLFIATAAFTLIWVVF